jgi:hypothetical protein
MEYNKAALVKPCPEGKEELSKSLDIYARAAVNLYGCIAQKSLAIIFNSQNGLQVSLGEVSSLLLPYVIKDRAYFFYKHYLVHPWAIMDFDYAKHIIDEQKGIPRHELGKEEFLKHADPEYRDPKQVACWDMLKEFLEKSFPQADTARCFRTLKAFGELDCMADDVSALLGSCGIHFKTEDQMDFFKQLLKSAAVNSRWRQYNGLTANEHVELVNNGKVKSLQDEKFAQFSFPCPCGSGAAYQDCCKSRSGAHLSSSERDLFNEAWNELMLYINEKMGYKRVKLQHITEPSSALFAKERDELCRKQSWISSYLSQASLGSEKRALVNSWLGHCDKKMCVMVSQEEDYDVVLTNVNDKDLLYGVRGLMEPLSSLVKRPLPYVFETVLLPFKDKIVFDGTLGLGTEELDEEMSGLVGDWVKNAKTLGVRTSLQRHPA